jgi:hypothetical protein
MDGLQDRYLLQNARWILCVVDRASRYSRVTKTNLMHYLWGWLKKLTEDKQRLKLVFITRMDGGLDVGPVALSV